MTGEDGLPPEPEAGTRAEEVAEEITVGRLLREARDAQGLSQEALAEELKLPLRLLQAVESDAWEAIPPGRQRPLARQLAARLRMDLDHHPDALGLVPGGAGEPAPDPGLEKLERGAMAALALGSVALLAWLLVPGQSLRNRTRPSWMEKAPPRAVPPPPPRSDGPYPVLGELLPEAPVTAEGLLLTLRSQDSCDAEVVGADGVRLARSLEVSDPWKLRVKGPFRLSLSNGGVVQVEVAGQPVATGAGVGQPWSGRFDQNGRWQRPAPPPVPKEPRTQEVAPEQPPVPQPEAPPPPADPAPQDPEPPSPNP